MKIKEGEILLLTRGCYSDFDFDGPFMALKSFDLKKECERLHKVSKEKWGFMYDVADALVQEKFIKKVVYREIHTGDYDFELSEREV